MKQTSLLADSLRIGLFALAAAGSAHAQQKIFVDGSQTNKEITLAAGSTVSFDANGNLTVKCALDNGVCTPLAGSVTNPPPANAPTITSFARNDADTDVRAGEFVRFIWGTSNASACAATTTGGTTAWTGVRATANGTGETITVAAAGTYQFGLQCFNAAGASAVSTVSVTVGEATTTPPPASNCDLPADPLIQPTGWVRTDRTWVQAWSAPDGDPVAAFPNSVGFPVPIGAAKGGYTVIPFTPIANQTVGISWEQVQANSTQGYRNPRPAHSMFLSISPCPGDVRAPVPSAADPWLRGGCRKLEAAGGLIWSTTDFTTNEQACKLNAGQTYYLNVMAADPAGGLTAGEHTCESVTNSANGCDVQATHRQ